MLASATRVATVADRWDEGTSAPARFGYADDAIDRLITESALREARDIISRELFGHYDIIEYALHSYLILDGRAQEGYVRFPK